MNLTNRRKRRTDEQGELTNQRTITIPDLLKRIGPKRKQVGTTTGTQTQGEPFGGFRSQSVLVWSKIPQN
ncbi:hypothetical protein GCM10028804_27110 [Larkinella terrae]